MGNAVTAVGQVYHCNFNGGEYYKVTGEDGNGGFVVQKVDSSEGSIGDIDNWESCHADDQIQPAGGSFYGSSKLAVTSRAAPTSGEPVSGNITSWVDEAANVLAQNGIYMSEKDKRNMAIIAQHESGGDPRAVNNWDDNAARGTPSKGLVQCIDSTFDAYKLPGHDNTFNPVDSIIAGYRYAVATYGSTDNVPGIRATGGGGGYVGY